MTTPESKIRLALFNAVADLDISGLDIATEVAWPGLHFDPPNDQTYIAVQFEPNNVERQFIQSNAKQLFSGLLLINVFWQPGLGERLAIERASAIADAFPPDLKLVADDYLVRITRRPDIGGMIEQDTSIQVPVTVWWEAYI